MMIERTSPNCVFSAVVFSSDARAFIAWTTKFPPIYANSLVLLYMPYLNPMRHVMAMFGQTSVSVVESDFSSG